MFAGSSKGVTKQNSDGSWNVMCYECSQFICRSLVPINRALCAICEAARTGRQLTPEFLAAYQQSKMERADINFLSLDKPPVPEANIKKKLRFASIAGPILTALGKFGLAQQTKPEERPTRPSAQIAKAKRRPRLFSGGLTDDTK